MRVHYLQHVPFEGLGSMESWLRGRDHQISSTQLYADQLPPAVDDVDWLIVMGGPMGVGDESRYPWLAAEKHFIGEVMAAGKPVLGVCLGAQLMADQLGASVGSNGQREIGWFPITPDAALRFTLLEGLFSDNQEVFHWHGDRFEIPAGAVALGSSEACANQGFVVGERIVGLQFHLETTPESARALIEHCGDELDGTRYVQTAESMLADPGRFQSVNRVMVALLERLEAAAK